MTQRRPLALDSSLAILLAVGTTGRRLIGLHERIAHDEADFELLLRLSARCERLVFSPNVSTETSNLSRYIPEPMRGAIATTVARIMAATGEDDVLESARAGATLLTEDVDPYRAALNAGLPAENFNHVRDSRPDFR